MEDGEGAVKYAPARGKYKKKRSIIVHKTHSSNKEQRAARGNHGHRQQ